MDTAGKAGKQACTEHDCVDEAEARRTRDCEVKRMLASRIRHPPVALGMPEVSPG